MLAIGGVTVAVAAFAYGRNAAQQSFDRLLVGAANQVAQSLSLRNGEVVADLPVSAFELLSLAPRDRITYGVFGADGQLLTGYDIATVPEHETTFFNGVLGDEPARFVQVSRPFAERTFGGTAKVVIGQTTQARREMAGQITRNALLAVGLVGLILSGLAVLTVQSALRPLRQIEQDIAARASKDLTMVDADVPNEIQALVVALNHFMARIDRQIGIMRNLIADASHQLRTPIAALRAQAELAAEETDPERQLAIVGRIHERSRNLSRLTDQLLSHALIIHRADALAGEQIDLRSIAANVVADMDQSSLVAGKTLRLNLSEAPVICLGDPFSLGEACKNLINNAVLHGVSPVIVLVDAKDGSARLRVRDAGPGIPDALWDEAATRFARKAGVSPKTSGLGLAIVNAVAVAHGGKMHFHRPAPDAFEVIITLPLKPEEPA